MASSTPPDPNSFYTIQLNGQADSCIVATPGVVPAQIPIRVQSCTTAGDYGLWQFISDGAGRYFVYNKGFTSSQRLDFVQPSGSLDILIMGPSGNIYNNQRWSLIVSSHLLELSIVEDSCLANYFFAVAELQYCSVHQLRPRRCLAQRPSNQRHDSSSDPTKFLECSLGQFKLESGQSRRERWCQHKQHIAQQWNNQ